MRFTSSRATLPRPACRRLLVSLACALLLSCLAQTPGARAGAGAAQAGLSGASGARLNVSAMLEQCVTAGAQAERSATFAGEMTAIGGPARMEMRIDVLEMMPGEAQFHTVSAPGLGVWRGSAAGVKIYTSINHVTNLSAPAFYRGAVRFRWLNAKGRLMKAMELSTPRCEQPAGPSSATSTTGTTSSSSSSTVG